MDTTAADAIITELCEELERARKLTLYAADDCGGFTDEHGSYTCESSPVAEIARDWAYRLLVAADVNGLHGCRLCKS